MFDTHEFLPALRECLAEHLEQTALWRDAKAEQYPEDPDQQRPAPPLSLQPAVQLGLQQTAQRIDLRLRLVHAISIP